MAFADLGRPTDSPRFETTDYALAILLAACDFPPAVSFDPATDRCIFSFADDKLLQDYVTQHRERRAVVNAHAYRRADMLLRAVIASAKQAAKKGGAAR